MKELIEKIDDLIIQATTDRSHYYVKSVLIEVKNRLALKNITNIGEIQDAYDRGREDMFKEIQQALIEKDVAMIKFKDEFNKTGLAINLNGTSIEEAKEVAEARKEYKKGNWIPDEEVRGNKK